MIVLEIHNVEQARETLEILRVLVEGKIPFPETRPVTANPALGAPYVSGPSAEGDEVIRRMGEEPTELTEEAGPTLVPPVEAPKRKARKPAMQRRQEALDRLTAPVVETPAPPIVVTPKEVLVQETIELHVKRFVKRFGTAKLVGLLTTFDVAKVGQLTDDQRAAFRAKLDEELAQ